MRRIALTLALLTSLALAASASAQSLTPPSAMFPRTPFRTDSAPIRFTLTAGATLLTPEVYINNTQTNGTFSQTNTCPMSGLQMAPTTSCFIDVVFAPYSATPAHKSTVLHAGGMTAALSGDGYLPGSGGKKKKCKKGKKHSAAAAKKCKKKH